MGILSNDIYADLKFADLINVVGVVWEPLTFDITKLSHEQIETRMVNGTGFEAAIRFLRERNYEKAGEVMFDCIYKYITINNEQIILYDIRKLGDGMLEFSLYSDRDCQYVYSLNFFLKKNSCPC